MRKKRLAIDFFIGRCYTVTNNGNFGGYTIMKKMKNWMSFVGTKNLIAIGALLVLVVAISVGIAISNSKTDEKVNDEVEESSGLQVEENAGDLEGDSIDFSEIVNEKEDPKLEVELGEDSKTGYKINKTDNAFADLKKEVQNVINDIKNGKTTSLPKDVQTALGEKKAVCDIFDLEPEKGQKKDEDGYYAVELTVDNLSKKYTKVVVLHYSEARELWEVIEPTKVDGDKITVKFADLSPVIIYGELIESEEDETLGSGNEGSGSGNNQGSNDTSAEFGPLF